MTWTHIVARVAVCAAGWFLTFLAWGVLFLWAEGERRTPLTDKLDTIIALIMSTVIWLLILGVIYW